MFKVTAVVFICGLLHLLCRSVSSQKLKMTLGHLI